MILIPLPWSLESPADYFMGLVQEEDLAPHWRKNQAAWVGGGDVSESLPDVKGVDTGVEVPALYRLWVIFQRCCLDAVSALAWSP
jgi:hypothetical protein